MATGARVRTVVSGTPATASGGSSVPLRVERSGKAEDASAPAAFGTVFERATQQRRDLRHDERHGAAALEAAIAEGLPLARAASAVAAAIVERAEQSTTLPPRAGPAPPPPQNAVEWLTEVLTPPPEGPPNERAARLADRLTRLIEGAASDRAESEGQQNEISGTVLDAGQPARGLPARTEPRPALLAHAADIADALLSLLAAQAKSAVRAVRSTPVGIRPVELKQSALVPKELQPLLPAMLAARMLDGAPTSADAAPENRASRPAAGADAARSPATVASHVESMGGAPDGADPLLARMLMRAVQADARLASLRSAFAPTPSDLRLGADVGSTAATVVVRSRGAGTRLDGGSASSVVPGSAENAAGGRQAGGLPSSIGASAAIADAAVASGGATDGLSTTRAGDRPERHLLAATTVNDSAGDRASLANGSVAGVVPSNGIAPMPSHHPAILQPFADVHGVVEQIVAGLTVRRLENGSQIRLRLVPDHLGEVTLKLSLEGTTLTATALAQSPDVRDLLLANQQSLARSLAGHGITLGGFSVDVSGGDARGGRDERSPRGFGPRITVHELGTVSDGADETLPAVATPPGSASRSLLDFLV